MNYLRRIASFLVVLTLLGSIATSASAAEKTAFANDIDEYIVFRSGPKRIASDGTFDINVRSALKSTSFTANKSKISVSVECKIYNCNTGVSTADNSTMYALRLYYADTNEEYGVMFFKADGTKNEGDFPVKVGQRYYFKIICDPALNMPLSVNGSGKITNVTA